MKDEDVKIGMRVVPHSKLNDNNFLSYGIVYKRALSKNQKYLYVINIEKFKIGNNNVYTLNDIIYENYQTGDFYIASDFEPDIKTERKEKLKNLNILCSK